VKASGDLEEVVAFGELLLVVIPTPFVESVMSKVQSKLTNKQVLL
jgi:glycerol-3-phosphate dehydrogenase